MKQLRAGDDPLDAPRLLTDVDGESVSDAELFGTISTALGLDPKAEHRLGKETLPVLPPGAKPIKTLLP